MSNWNILFNGNLYPAKWYEPTDGNIGVCGYDSETTMIENQQTPDFILGMAYNGKTIYFIKKENLKSFFDNHQRTTMFLAKGSFDLRVAEKAQAISNALLSIKNRIIYGEDVLLHHKLIKLATDGKNTNPSLDRLAQEYLETSLPKDATDEEGNSVRIGYGKFLNQDGSISYDKMGQEYFRYAGIDAVATFLVGEVVIRKNREVCEHHGVDVGLRLSHDLQLMADLCLDQISANGLNVDMSHLNKIRSELQAEMDKDLAVLKSQGWEPGTGSAKRMQYILNNLGIDLDSFPRTETGKLKVSANVLGKYKEFDVIAAYISYTETKKLMDFLAKKDGEVHARFNVLVATGRTSSYSPNIQNLPRDARIRKIFKARDGHCFVSVDYSGLEMNGLAQENIDRSGSSKMAELINAGRDLHTYYASKILGCAEELVTKDARQKAKAVNFGFPGGLGIKSFVDYSSLAYGVNLSEDEARTLKDLWLNTFPEMKTYLQHDDITDLVKSGLMRHYGKETGRYGDDKIAAFIFKGIINGQISTKSGRDYTQEEIDWAYDILANQNFFNKDKYEKAISKKSGSYKLYGDFIRQFNVVKFKSGRVRGSCTYTQSKNTPFQGMSADGAKWAMVLLTLAGYKIVNFIHDEFIFELPLSIDLKKAETEIKSLMILGMNMVMPNIKVKAEAEYMISWSKDGTHYLDADGKLVPNEVPTNKLGYNHVA
ncbi:MAG: hypothetical protein KF802_02555 [Bdellovibrionaceae bacterium]|nr:hypothetical protein [Pseudobdellovibrionaceae bacterium]